MAVALAALSLVIWLLLAFMWHGFWKADQKLPRCNNAPGDWPSVCILVPARNEAETIMQCIANFASQDYPGDLRAIIVDDSSTDDTAALARDATMGVAKFVVASATPLEPGWAGKLWALNTGLQLARRKPPDYYWLCDADIVHDSDTLSRLIAHAHHKNLAMASLMVRLRCEGFWEKLLVPAFIFYFQLIYPFRAVNDSASTIAGAAGGCVLIKAEVLESIGGFEAVKDAIIDDCTIAKAVKDSGHAIWLGLGEGSHSVRGYERLQDFWMMVVRSAFTQLKQSWLLLAGAMAGLAITYIAPPLLVLSMGLPGTGGLALAAFLIMTACYWPTVRYHGLSALWVFSLPLAALLFGLMSIHSALKHAFGRGVAWKGREL